MHLDTANFAKNDKKIFSNYCLLMKFLFICLIALFMSHEQCNRCWFKKKRGAETHLRGNADAIQMPSKCVFGWGDF